MSENQVKFQNLLRELFQFDCADLDFGIYRIMNHKLDVEGNLVEKYRETRAGKEYLEAQQRAKGSRSHEALDGLFKARMFGMMNAE